jgi:hypothetical protein
MRWTRLQAETVLSILDEMLAFVPTPLWIPEGHPLVQAARSVLRDTLDGAEPEVIG